MREWEYRIETLPLNADGIPDGETHVVMNALGADGWEVIHFGMYSDRKGGGSMTGVAICKRIKLPALFLVGAVGIGSAEVFGSNGAVTVKRR